MLTRLEVLGVNSMSDEGVASEGIPKALAGADLPSLVAWLTGTRSLENHGPWSKPGPPERRVPCKLVGG